jgi:hypothetical protein
MVLDPSIGEIVSTETKNPPAGQVTLGDLTEPVTFPNAVATDKEIAAAQKLGTEIVAVASTVQADLVGGVDTFRALVQQAKEAPHFLEVAVAGKSFADWKEFVDYVIGQVPNLHSALRVEFAKVLKNEGMSYRDIAKSTGTAKSQIARDIKGISQRATVRVEKDGATARGETSNPSPRPVTNVTTRAVSALEKCSKVDKKDAETVYPLRSDKVSSENLTEYRAMLVQSLQDVDAEIDRRKTEVEFAAIIAEVQANPGQYKDVVERAKAKANHPTVTGRPNGNNPRVGLAATG